MELFRSARLDGWQASADRSHRLPTDALSSQYLNSIPPYESSFPPMGREM